MLDVVWVSIAFAFGLGARLVGLPPMTGYLLAGFVLFWAGVDAGETLAHFSEMGVTLLLFSIGLKLRLGTLLKPHVWGVASLHMGLVVLGFGSVFAALGVLGLSLFAELQPENVMLLAFAVRSQGPVEQIDAVMAEYARLDLFSGTVLVARDGESEDSARRILAAQSSRSERLAIADDVITNDGGLEKLREQVAALHDEVGREGMPEHVGRLSWRQIKGALLKSLPE